MIEDKFRQVKERETKSRAILEGVILGIGALLVTILWVVLEAFHPLLIFLLYLVALFSLSISIIWLLARGSSMRSWFVKQPTRFFIVGFIEVLLIVGFLDIYYLGKLGGVLVEAHGLVFDLFIFGIVLTAYDAIRQAEENKKRREAEKQQRIKRYKEELDDYRGWREKEAGYRVAGIIRRLKKEGVEDVVFDRLNLGQCSKEIVEKAVVAKAHIISLEGANLEYANLQNANLKRANLHRTNLKRANLHGADLEYANLLRLRVNEIDWIENLKKWKVKGVDNIESRYYVDKTPLKFDQDTLYKIRERPKKDDDIPKQCKGETIKGTPCKRKSKPGFNKCYQHLNGV